jgi:hypothetical protein
MQMKARILAVALALCALWSTPAHAWDEVGHRVVARIAWDNMTPAARTRAIQLLRAAPARTGLAALEPSAGTDEARIREWFVQAAVWSDIIRSRNNIGFPYAHADWHYVNFFWQQGPNGPVDRDDIPRAGLLIDQMQRISGELGNSAVADSSQAIDLAWALHLVGDAHQPLHNNARITAQDTAGDRGGNDFRLAGLYPYNNLHGYWDALVGNSMPWRLQDRTEADYVDGIALRVQAAYPRGRFGGRILPGQFETWSREGLRVAQRAYPSWLERNSAAPPRYHPYAWNLVESRVALGGYRLADFLNTRLGGR